MADPHKSGLPTERNVDQALTSLKKGAYLLKYGRRGKPKFCPFHLSNDESTLIWYSGREEKHLKLSNVSRIIPGQRTAIFQRYPRPEKEYQSFSLICSDRTLDLICKDKDEAEVWLVGLKALITRGYFRKWRSEVIGDNLSSDSPRATQKSYQSVSPFEPGDTHASQSAFESGTSPTRLGKAFSEIIAHTASTRSESQSDLPTSSLSPLSAGGTDTSNSRTSGSDTLRISLSSAVSSSSQGSCREDFDAVGEVFIWGEGIGEGILGGGAYRVGESSSGKIDSAIPKILESNVVLDVHNLACGYKHAVVVNRQGELFSWGEELGGRLGHGGGSDLCHPQIVDTLSGMSIELVACGKYHTCAVTVSGELYTWGDGTHNAGLLGNGSEASHWVPKRVSGCFDGLHVSYIACGVFHTAMITSTGQLFTFGDGSLGALGHGDHCSTSIPKLVEALQGLRTTRVACGIWHTAAVVETMIEPLSVEPSSKHTTGNLYTWGYGDRYQLGHGDREPRTVPECVTALSGRNIHQVACGHEITIAVTALGEIFAMGSTIYGQLGNHSADGKTPNRVEGKVATSCVEEIACGSYHVAVLTSQSEVFTWGKGSNGQLGHADYDNREIPTLVDFLRDKQVKRLACGSNFTAVICVHKRVSSIDHSVCSGCRNPFNFRRKRHNCYNCGLVFCKACSNRKSLKASLAPNMTKPFRVCEDCYIKLKKATEFSSSASRKSKTRSATMAGSLDIGDRVGRPHRHFARLLSVDSITWAESQKPALNFKNEPAGTRLFRYLNKGSPLRNFTVQKEPISLSTMYHFPGSGSRFPSRSTSPISVKSSPPRSSEATTVESKTSYDGSAQEVMSLRMQVQDLTAKAHHLQTELDKTSRRLKEVTAIAADETQKCKTAKEVITSLSTQLKEMAERLPEGQKAIQISGSVASDMNNNTNSKSVSTPEMSSTNISVVSNGNEQQSNKGEWVVQDEPGVYITLAALPNNAGNELKRIRFSRRHFTEEKAEKWWAANGTNVFERYNIHNA